jgi:hypothetical protein
MALAELMTEDTLEAHDSPLLYAARIKLQSLRELAEEHVRQDGTDTYPSLPVIQDYNQLLAVARKAAPDLKLALPPDILTPFHTQYQAAYWYRHSFWTSLSRLWKSDVPKDDDESARLITYRELSTLCRQIERLLK